MKGSRKLLLTFLAALALVLGTQTLFAEAAQKDYSTCYKVSGQKITIKKGYKNKDITEILNAALTKARDTATAKKPVTVKLPKGTYKLTSNLRIYSNTTLDLTGVTLKYTGKESHVMLQSGINGAYKGVSNYNQSRKCSGYKGFQNITIKGGTFQSTTSNTGSIIRIAHAKNVVLNGVTFKGGGCAHQVEVAAINGFYVKNCTFKDWDGAKKTGYENEKYEALQLDIPCSSKVYCNFYQDGTVMKNVEITGCTFSNVPRGVGTHTFLLGAYHQNIKINNNTFQNIEEEAIVCLGYKNSEVKNNTIVNCGAGILFQYFKANTKSVFTTILDGKKSYKGTVEHNANSVISGNTITIKYTKESDEVQGIKVYGLNLEKAASGADGKKISAKDYYISGVTISKNTITTAGYGIHLMDARNCTITGNKITGKGVNSASESGYSGIYLLYHSSAKTISNNTVSDMTDSGILVRSYSQVTGSISGNTVDTVSSSGIYISNNSSVGGSITDNTIRNAASYGIFVYDEADNSTVGGITGNTITDAGSYGINLSSISNDMEISKNIVSGCKNHGLMIHPTGNTSLITIRDNTIQGTGNSYNGIQVFRGNISISNNTLSHVAQGIHISTGVTGTIDWNTYGDGVTKQIWSNGKSFVQTGVVKLS